MADFTPVTLPTAELRKMLDALLTEKICEPYGRNQILEKLYQAMLQNKKLHIADLLKLPRFKDADENDVCQEMLKLKNALRSHYVETPDREFTWRPVIFLLEERNGYSLVAVQNVPKGKYGADQLAKIKKSEVVAVVHANLHDWFSGLLLTGVLQGCSEHGFRAVSVNSADDQVAEGNHLRSVSGKVRGIIAIPVGEWDTENAYRNLLAPEAEEYEEAEYDHRRKPVALVFADRVLRGFERWPRVGSDGYAGGRLAAKYLIEQRGCQHVFVLTERPVTTLKDRIDGCRRELEVRRMLPSGWDYECVLRSHHREQLAGYELMERLGNQLKSYDRVGVFATNDPVAEGALAYLRQKGLPMIPMVGFDGRHAGQPFGLPIPTIRQDMVEVGHKAMDQLFLMMTRRKVKILFEKVPITLIEPTDLRFA